MTATAIATRAAAAAELLARQGLCMALAESCTGGRIAAALTAISGISRSFAGGVVAYSNESKAEFLGVEPDAIETHGAVSEVVASQMATGALQRFAADLAIATTGIAGPLGGTSDKPVGLVFIALATRTEVRVSRCVFTGTRATVQDDTTQEALDMLLAALKETHQQKEY